jgi:hypothetical protein
MAGAVVGVVQVVLVDADAGEVQDNGICSW